MKLRNNGVLLFRTQLFLALLPIIVLPLAIMGYFSYNISYHALQARSTANVNQISSLVNQNLDNTLQQAIQLAKTPLYDFQLQQIISYYSQHPTLTINNMKLQDIQVLKDFSLKILLQNQEKIDSVDLYTSGNTVFSESFFNFQPFPNWHSQSWFDKLMSTSVRTIILPFHSIRFDAGETSVFSVAQAIVNTDTFQTVGTIVINIDTKNAIEHIINASSKKSDTIFLVYDADNQKIYATPSNDPSTENIYLQLSLLHSAQRALKLHQDQFTWEQKNYFLSSSTSKLSGLTVTALVPSSTLTQDIQAITQTTIGIIGIMLIIVIGSAFFLVHRFSQHITQIRLLMMQVETGNLDVRFQAQGRGEIASLGKSFNLMVIRLKQGIQDNYESQLQRKKAELTALQSQIHPHFLYNTLSTFQMLALLEKQERLARMSYELGQLLRYSLEAASLIDLGQELQSAQHFLSLMKERYEERLQVDIQVPETLLHYTLPKFTLQPLIENALYHGLDPKVAGGLVQIKGYQDGAQLKVEIIDDGVGMQQTDLQLLQDALRYEANILKRAKHIGILNVQGQIQRIFGPDYGLDIETSLYGGIKVTLHLPLSEQGEMERE